MKVEKRIGCEIGTETFLGFSIIQGDHVVHKFSGVRSRLGNNRDEMTYYLYNSCEEKEAAFAYKYIISVLEKEYNLRIFPNYNDEMETYVASCRIGEHYFDVLYDCEYGSVRIKEKYVKEVDDGFVENLAVWLLLAWLKVTDTLISSNEIAVQLVQEQPKQEYAESKTPVTTQALAKDKPVRLAKNAKSGFWERLFGKKNKNSTTVTTVAPANPDANRKHKEVKPVTAPISKPAVLVSAAGQTAPATPKAPVQSDPQQKPAPAREMVEKLSDLRVGFSPVKEMSEECAGKLRRLGAEFFRDVEQVMVNEPGNTPDLQLKAILRFARYFETVPLANYSFSDNTTCPEAGKLEYYGSWSAGGICYDGGCYSSEGDDNYYFVLRRITAEEYNEKKVSRAKLFKGSHTIWRYKVDLPEADSTEVFVDNRSRLYLKNPMGILGCFQIERDDR